MSTAALETSPVASRASALFASSSANSSTVVRMGMVAANSRNSRASREALYRTTGVAAELPPVKCPRNQERYTMRYCVRAFRLSGIDSVRLPALLAPTPSYVDRRCRRSRGRGPAARMHRRAQAAVRRAADHCIPGTDLAGNSDRCRDLALADTNEGAEKLRSGGG